MLNEEIRQSLLDQGYTKVGSKTFLEYWKKGDEVLTVYTRDIKIEDGEAWDNGFDIGYQTAINQIKINLDHFKKDVYRIEMIYEGGMDMYEGESACEKLLKEEILGGS